MKLSAFTIIKNATKYDYPVIESIKSLEPFVDEYVINIGDSEDDTEKIVRDAFGDNPKFVLFNSKWEDSSEGMAFFRTQTNKALEKCTGDWVFYLQSDECVHEEQIAPIKNEMAMADEQGKKAIMFEFLHFEKNYSKLKKTYSEGFDAYEREIRAFKNDGNVFSHGDAMGFAYKDKGVDLKAVPDRLYLSRANIFHYGYVKDPKTMLEKKLYLKEFYFNDSTFSDDQRKIEEGKIRSKEGKYKYSRQLNDFNGTHPSSMLKRIASFNEKHPDLL